MSVATLGIMLTYVLSFLMALLFGASLPLISLSSAATGGTMAWVAVGINVLILGIAAMWLIVDFGMIEQRIAAGGPRSIEWYCTFALLVSLAWIYFEAVKLVFRLALIFGNRD